MGCSSSGAGEVQCVGGEAHLGWIGGGGGDCLRGVYAGATQGLEDGGSQDSVQKLDQEPQCCWLVL